MIRTSKLLWRILIIVLLNLLVISFVVYRGYKSTIALPDSTKTNNAIVKLVENLKSIGLNVDGFADFFTLKAKAAPPSGGATQHGSADAVLLAKVISAEGRAEPYSGQVAIGAVILNRVQSPSFPDTITAVVYQPDAFTCMTDGNINQPVVESAKRAAQDALNGIDPCGGAIYYYNPAKTSNAWMKARPVVTTIGKHIFCN